MVIQLELFFDLSDAFGSVNRCRLLYKLGKDFGISGKLFLHICSFLDHRQARLKMNNMFGQWIGSDIGTSAGTQLGPLLFVTYLHDVPRCISPKFADNLVALAAGANSEEVEKKLQFASDQLSRWAKREKMQINVKKTKMMMFGDTGKDVVINIEGTVIEHVTSFKYLGVVMHT